MAVGMDVVWHEEKMGRRAASRKANKSGKRTLQIQHTLWSGLLEHIPRSPRLGGEENTREGRNKRSGGVGSPLVIGEARALRRYKLTMPGAPKKTSERERKERSDNGTPAGSAAGSADSAGEGHTACGANDPYLLM